MRHFNFVEWSVAEVNRRCKDERKKCPKCDKRSLRILHDIRPEYKSQHNPGECLVMDCLDCGYHEVRPC